MKKIIIYFVCVFVLLCGGCSKEPAQDIVEESTPAMSDVNTEPENNLGNILGNKVPAVLTSLKKDDVVDILGENGNYYIVRFGQTQGFLEKCLVHVEGDESYESWTGHTKQGAILHENFKLTDSGKELNANTNVQVLEDLAWCYHVQVENTLGYMSTTDVYRDGGEIYLNETEDISVSNDAQNTGVTGNVLVDGAEICCTYFDRNERVEVLTYDEESCTVNIDGNNATISRYYIQLEKDAEYEIWTGYARNGAVVYDDSCLYIQLVQGLEMNTEVTVLNQLGDCYLVEVEDFIGYMKLQDVSNQKYSLENGSANVCGERDYGDVKWTQPVL